LQERNTEVRVKEKIVQLGVDYKLCSRETSFVAVEKREKPVTGETKLRRVPVALTRDWGKPDGPMDVTGVFASFSMQQPSIRLDISMQQPSISLDMQIAAKRPSIFASLFSRHASEPSKQDVPSRNLTGLGTTDVPLLSLIALQKADGSWELSVELAAVLKRPLKALESFISDATGDAEEVRRAFATALAIDWLGREAAESKDKWQLLEKKASKWLSTCRARPSSGERWEELAGRYFGGT